MLRLGSRNMGADRGTNCHEERDESEPAAFVGLVEIPVQQDVCRLPLIAVPQVHQQESQIVQHVDGGEALIELETIEQGRNAVPQADVAQDEVARLESRIGVSSEEVVHTFRHVLPERITRSLELHPMATL